MVPIAVMESTAAANDDSWFRVCWLDWCRAPCKVWSDSSDCGDGGGGMRGRNARRSECSSSSFERTACIPVRCRRRRGVYNTRFPSAKQSSIETIQSAVTRDEPFRSQESSHLEESTEQRCSVVLGVDAFHPPQQLVHGKAPSRLFETQTDKRSEDASSRWEAPIRRVRAHHPRGERDRRTSGDGLRTPPRRRPTRIDVSQRRPLQAVSFRGCETHPRCRHDTSDSPGRKEPAPTVPVFRRRCQNRTPSRRQGLSGAGIPKDHHRF
mmetsp:Transcript_4729/g.12129  ORF Transcript_4729/g.12129 Transcript_4729/m.12129 type:complete len:266 (-) Transcript_4729:153-950(-)